LLENQRLPKDQLGVNIVLRSAENWDLIINVCDEVNYFLLTGTKLKRGENIVVMNVTGNQSKLG
jgi:hypothetical protein